MNQKMIRITALVLALLIVGSVFIAAITSAAALDPTAAAIPDTGSDGVPKAPIIIGAAAVLLAVVCVVVPKIAKK